MLHVVEQVVHLEDNAVAEDEPLLAGDARSRLVEGAGVYTAVVRVETMAGHLYPPAELKIDHDHFMRHEVVFPRSQPPEHAEHRVLHQRTS